eukprot:5757376-Amphidinium_carterae.1
MAFETDSSRLNWPCGRARAVFRTFRSVSHAASTARFFAGVHMCNYSLMPLTLASTLPQRNSIAEKATNRNKRMSCSFGQVPTLNGNNNGIP